MTVGLSFRSQEVSVTVADSKRTELQKGRESNVAIKLGEFKTDNYHGVVYGSGVASFLENIHENVEEYAEDSENVEEFAFKIKYALSEEVDNYIHQIQLDLRKDMEMKAATLYAADKGKIKDTIHSMFGTFMETTGLEGILQNLEGDVLNRITEGVSKVEATVLESVYSRAEQDRLRFLDQEKQRVLNHINDVKKDLATELYIEAFDKKQEKLVRYYVSPAVVYESHLSYDKTGSGSDGAGFYFDSKTQGLDPKKLELTDLVFHVANAYCSSTINRGVGGTPQIAIIDKDDIKYINKEEVAIMTNMCGAYMAELVDKDFVMEHLDQVLDKKANNVEIAERLGITEDTLTKATIPYSTWQERANYKCEEARSLESKESQ